MTSSLPKALPLMKDAWQLFRAHWQKTLNITIWFVYIGFIRFALYASGGTSSSNPLSLISFPIELGAIVISCWVSIRLVRYILSLEAGKETPQTPEESSKAWPLVLPMLWIGVLEAVIVFGGFILLVIPGIYLMISLSFSNLFLLEKNMRGIPALAASRALVKGRWLATFWRILAGAIIFGGIIGLVTGMIFAIFASLAGETVVNGMTMWGTQPLVEGAMALVSGILQALAVPLFIIYHVKIFRALETSR